MLRQADQVTSTGVVPQQLEHRQRDLRDDIVGTVLVQDHVQVRDVGADHHGHVDQKEHRIQSDALEQCPSELQRACSRVEVIRRPARNTSSLFIPHSLTDLHEQCGESGD